MKAKTCCFCEGFYLLWHKGNLLCESLYLLWHTGQPALWVTNGWSSVLNPTSILSIPMGIDNDPLVVLKACIIQFIESSHFKYRIYKPREVEHQIKKLVCHRTCFVSLSDVQPSLVHKSHISNGPINKLYMLH